MCFMSVLNTKMMLIMNNPKQQIWPMLGKILFKRRAGSVFIESALQDLSGVLVSVLFAYSAIHQPPR